MSTYLGGQGGRAMLLTTAPVSPTFLQASYCQSSEMMRIRILKFFLLCEIIYPR